MTENGNQSGPSGKKDTETLKKLRKTIAVLRQGIEDMRLTTLYNRFDLEATRRERDYLLKLLNGDNKNKK